MIQCKIKSSFIPADHMRALTDAIASSRSTMPLGIVRILQEHTDDAPPASPNGRIGAVDTGTFRSGWEIDHTASGAVIENRTEGAAAIDGGRRPGATAPPADAIQDWVSRNIPASPSRQASLAYIIAQNIASRGLKPRFIVKRSQPEIAEYVFTTAQLDINRRYARLALTPMQVVY